jgi:hypothetical protein
MVFLLVQHAPPLSCTCGNAEKRGQMSWQVIKKRAMEGSIRAPLTVPNPRNTVRLLDEKGSISGVVPSNSLPYVAGSVT